MASNRSEFLRRDEFLGRRRSVGHDERFTGSAQGSKLGGVSTTEAAGATETKTSPADLGLLILRVGVGAAMIQAGLIKALDFGTTVGFMEAGGWRLPTIAALMV